MLSNRLFIDFWHDFNIDQIEQDFEIIKVAFRPSNNSWKDLGRVRRALSFQYKARATAYLSGATFYLMYDAGSYSLEATRQVLEDNHFTEVLPRRVDIKEEFMQDPEFKSTLLQLFLNYTANALPDDDLIWNNTLGGLLYHHPSWNRIAKSGKYIGSEIRWFVDIRVKKDLTIFPEVKTFMKLDINEGKGVAYDFDSEGRFRPVYNRRKGIAFFFKGEKDRKSSVDFINIKNYREFVKTKVGVLYTFFKSATPLLDPYVCIHHWDYSNANIQKIPVKLDSKGTLQKCIERMKTRGVNLYDFCPVFDASKKAFMIENIKEILREDYGIELTIGELSKEKYNIVIQHAKSCYDKTNIDPIPDFIKTHRGYIMQGICPESLEFPVESSKNYNKDLKTFRSTLTMMMRMITKELPIKEDIDCAEPKISIMDWTTAGFDSSLYFAVRRTKENKDDDEKYCVMKILPNGRLEFENFNEKDCIRDHRRRAIRSAFKEDAFSDKNDEAVELIAWTDIDNIYQFRSTNERTMPNWQTVGENMEHADDKMTKVAFFSLYDDFCHWVRQDAGNLKIADNDLKGYRLKLEAALEEVEDGKEVKYKALDKALNLKSNKRLALPFLWYLCNVHGILLDPHFRNGEFNDRYDYHMLDSLVGAYYFPTPRYEKVEETGSAQGVANDPSSYSYFVGIKGSLDQSGPQKGCVIRQLRTVSGDPADPDFVSRLLSLVTVEFIRLACIIHSTTLSVLQF